MEKDGALKPAAEETVAPETLKAGEAPATGTQPTWAQAQWTSIKSKALGAKEYAVTKTRQTFSMFGETNKQVESSDKGGAGASKDESSPHVRSFVMEGKQLSAVAPAVAAAPSMHLEEVVTRPLEQLKEEEAIASTEQQRGWMRGTALAWTQWASIKSKARAAGEYAVLRTRQGITMFGEPKLGPLVKAAAANEESQ
ncbi:hypothetical protein BAE44_0000008 [Dichanthelium oligosanthes]|uniref:Uncharacterized protein n=1 Tax=Dichanthelium oligosanthes TaxID=888268 RepID=A0A1E5WNJ7_9POAL|nr:hypothetical protein BAE44_0000008 [Dichanthelium oligosanthes]